MVFHLPGLRLCRSCFFRLLATSPALNTTGLILLAAGLILLAGCSSQDDQRSFEDEALKPPDGITETDGSGNIVESNEDPDDWRTSPFYQGLISFEPAYPNPALTSDAITIRAFVSIDAGLDRLSAHVYHYERESWPELDVIDSSPIPSGEVQLQFSAQNLTRPGEQTPGGLYRILIFDGRGHLVSYGDIEIE
jgi:hypothetical protein